MENRIRVFLADPSPEYLLLLSDILNTEPDMKVVAAVSDGASALERLTAESPDVLVTELLLPHVDGLSLIRKLRELGRLPRTVVHSAFFNTHMMEEVSRLGADDYLLKPCDANLLTERVREAISPETRRLTQSYDKMIHSALSNFNVSAHLSGWSYAYSAIQLALQDHSLLNAITKALYPALARQYGTQSACIERSIRSAIIYGWEHGSPEQRSAYFGKIFDNYKKAPSNGRFIAQIVYFIESKYENIDVWAAK